MLSCKQPQRRLVSQVVRMNMQQSTPAPGTSLRERKKTAKQERILQAATRLFAEKGYEAATTAEIAEAADVGVGTLFRYAGSKAELLVAVMNNRCGRPDDSRVDRHHPASVRRGVDDPPREHARVRA